MRKGARAAEGCSSPSDLRGVPGAHWFHTSEPPRWFLKASLNLLSYEAKLLQHCLTVKALSLPAPPSSRPLTYQLHPAPGP
ncbi:hypothetical protein P4O66_002529 [Electrophorus voltai]|uniref:Uncharacterized protein n=1 Tax=Electrophorus voltai TaxID=2609070 RepID=A0AAD8YZJ1_9TELE|nr:hypothetical protein P4O66_002529 [Electrophorus voltai]